MRKRDPNNNVHYVLPVIIITLTNRFFCASNGVNAHPYEWS